ncbi:tetratricopeptide repeat protein [Lysobacter brunescens]|uniref:Tetratricopeptide repeat protein n=1 Tax=Lysobacter brunescens TaxID=262323 RepID=A0ABW2YG14_9GAMM
MRIAPSILLLAAVVLPAGYGRAETTATTSAEPKENTVVIFRTPDGQVLTLADLRGLDGTFQYQLIGSDNVPAEAESLHRQARQAGAAGDYPRAITLLQQAAELAPAWPYPVYDMAFTYLLMNDSDNARKYYVKTVELSPRGFFTAITASDALCRERKGDLPEGTYLAYLSLEWMDDPERKAEAVRQLVERIPRFAPVWKEQAILAGSSTEKLAAIEKGLAANPDGETKGILTINKALIMAGNGDHDGAVQLLGNLALDPTSTYATEHLAKVTLASLVEE